MTMLSSLDIIDRAIMVCARLTQLFVMLQAARGVLQDMLVAADGGRRLCGHVHVHPGDLHGRL